MMQFSSSFFLAFLVLILWGCDASTTPDLDSTSPDLFTPVMSEAALRAAVQNQERAKRIVYPFKTHDDLMLHIAERAPGFGGVYTDDELRPHIYLRDPSDKEAAARVIDELTVADHMTGAYRTIFAYYGKAKAMGSMVIHKADYSIDELAAMREQLRAQALPGIGGIGIAEDKNRLSVELEAGFSEQTVRMAVSRLDVPAGALLFQEFEPAEDLVTLQDRVRPAAGGLRVRTPGACTLGFPTYTESGKEGFVTASHCTSNMGQDDNDPAYQNNSVSSDLIGTEEVDPPFLPPSQVSNPNCISTYDGCRYSDAVFFKEAGYTAIQQHLVVKTVGVQDNTPNGTNVAGSLTIATLNTGSWLQYAGRVYYATVGTHVDKVGASAGWTRGEIDKTSHFQRPSTQRPGYHILDVDRVDEDRANPGDSGAIVFYHAGGRDIVLHGILFQGNQSQYYYYSAIRHVEFELFLLFS